MRPKKRVVLISLGCAKNLVDSENMLGLLDEAGYSLVSEGEEAEIAIVNTCGFVQPAVEESIDTILGMAASKRQGILERLIVTGCFVQRYGYRLRREIPEVDAWLGTGQFHRILEILGQGSPGDAPVPASTLPPTLPPMLISRPTYLADHTVPRVRTTPSYTAYVKIAEGCSHMCSFCTIPHLRGPFRSRTPESLVAEVTRMAEAGVKEINLVAQDTTMYGLDLENGVRLEDLIERLLGVEGIAWIRLLYSHPLRISDRLLGLIAAEERICPYLDVPLQHVNREILSRMGRAFGREGPRGLIQRIRACPRPLSLRTTLMVGFPGETDQRFRELYDFVKWAEFEHLGVFIYSPEKGTAAALFKQGVKGDVAQQRQAALMELQAEIAREKNRRLEGKTLPVLVEGFSPETDLLLRGRTAFMAPDVDGQVLINRGQAVVGDIQAVTIREAHAYDLIGEIA